MRIVHIGHMWWHLDCALGRFYGATVGIETTDIPENAVCTGCEKPVH